MGGGSSSQQVPSSVQSTKVEVKTEPGLLTGGTAVNRHPSSCSSSADLTEEDDEDLAVPLDTHPVAAPPKRLDIEEESRSSATGELDPSIRNVLITATDHRPEQCRSGERFPAAVSGARTEDRCTRGGCGAKSRRRVTRPARSRGSHCGSPPSLGFRRTDRPGTASKPGLPLHI